jgi:hypothetical protein
LIKPKGGGAKALAELIVDGVVTITPELAHRIIQEAPYEKQRPIRPKHVDALATQMRRREWTPGTQLHFGRLPDGSLHLVNGNHRMHAVVRSDTSVPFQLLVSEVRDEKGLNTLYRRHDRLTSPRTAIDALSAEGIPDAHGLRHEIARACFNAVPVINAHFRPPRHYGDAYLQRSDEARLAAAVEWWPVAGIAQEAITKAPWNIKHRLQSVGVMAVMLVTVRYQELKAYAFWQGLADNNGLSRNDPRASYLRYLSVNRVRGLHETSKSAAIAWNAFYAGEELQIIRVTPGPITIDGTPFNKPPKD